MAPIITLTTDFGLRDPFVGIMKGVILGICPAARLVDLTHEVPPRDVLAGALALEAAVPFFPAGTIHLAVVDPGVGSARRGLALRAGRQYFVGPDNGLFTFALAGADWSAVAVEASELRLDPVSRTFHGRDVFAPAAAHLGAGVFLDRLGGAIRDPVRLPVPSARLEGGQVVGEVIAVDRFGNLVTSVKDEDVRALCEGGRPVVEAAGRIVGAPVEAYVDAPPGSAAAIIGSTGRLEIFVRDGSASDALGALRGTPVTVRCQR